MNLFRDAGSLPPESRPRIRWWIPGTMADKAELIHELRMLKEAGFAGAEVAPSKMFNPVLGRIEGGWGLARWTENFRAILAEAKKQDFAIDLMILCSSPMAIPLVTDASDPSEGVRMELDGAHIDGITREHPYDGPVPVSAEAFEDAEAVGGRAELYAVTVAKVLDKERRILAFDSVRELDLASCVTKTGGDARTWKVRFAPEDEGEYALFTWWAHPSGENTAGIPQLDFYGKAGTARLIDYFENTFLPSLGEDAKTIRSLFTDSIEWAAHLDFTPGFREEFVRRYGYDLVKYLPALYEQEWSGVYRVPAPDFRFERGSEQLYHAYGDFLTRLYAENHLIPLRAFCQRHGMTLRAQTSYGKALELANTAGCVDIPDTETLYGKDIVDFYRIQSGAFHIHGAQTYSVEASAEAPGRGNGDANSGNYEQTFKKQLWHLQRAYAGGVNQVYFHGCRYRGQYTGEGNENGFLPGVSWPGYEPMGRVRGCSNTWDERQPNWAGMKQLTDALSRIQYILQKGKAAPDLAFYYHNYMETIDAGGAKKVFDSPSLEQAGYSYDFVCPDDLNRGTASGSTGKARLAIGEASYKALLLYRQKTLPRRIVRKLGAFADAGIPVVFCEGVPEEPAFPGEESIREEVGRLLEKESVRCCPDAAELPELLMRIGAEPDASYEKPEAVLTVHRKTEECDWFWFYNYADADTFPEMEKAGRVRFGVNLNCEGTPYLLDPWTGAVRRAAFERTRSGGDGMKLTLELAANDSLIVPVRRSGDIGVPEVEPDREMAEADCFVLRDWMLTVESWTPGDSPIHTAKKEFDPYALETPVPRTQIEELETVSGEGIYRCEFDLENGYDEGWGAVVSAVSVCDCYRVKINGTEVPANQVDPVIDIGRYVRKGRNTLEIAVYSTLLNAAIAYTGWSGIKPPFQSSGLTVPVIITPYKRLT